LLRGKVKSSISCLFFFFTVREGEARVRKQGHMRESAIDAASASASTHAQHHTMLMMMKRHESSNFVSYIEKKMITKSRNKLGQSRFLFLCMPEIY
jgi:hypothetical protein